MQNFRYRGVTPNGDDVSGTIEAGHQSGALQQLMARNIRAYEIAPSKAANSRQSNKKPKSADYLRMLDQLSVLIEAEISVTEAVQSLINTVEHRKIADELAKTLTLLRRGERLGSAIETAIPSLPALVPNLIRLGETTGNLAEVLQLTSRQLGLQERIRQNLLNSLLYPAFLIIVGILVSTFLFLVVVPRFADMLGDNIKALPFLSRCVFEVSAFMTEQWPVMLLALLAMAGGGLLLSRLPAVRAALMGLAFATPIIGPLLRQFELANWTRTVGIAFGARANLLDAVTLARSCVSERNNAAGFDEIVRSLRAGTGLDEAMAKTPGMEKMVIDLVATGIKAGRMADMLMLATKILDDKIETSAGRIAKMAEPVAMLVIASLIGLVVISLVTAMTSMYDFALPV